MLYSSISPPIRAIRNAIWCVGLRLRDRKDRSSSRYYAELTDEGALERGRKRSYVRPGELPDMAVLEICGEDPDGEPLARPLEWEGTGPVPLVLVVPGRDEMSAPGRGERILARISRNRTDQTYEARIIKRLGASAHRALGVVKIQPGQLARVEPVDRKSRHAFTLEAGSIAGVKDGDLVTVEPMAGRGIAGPRARIVERFGSIREARSISLIAIHAHGIPTDFPREALVEAERSALLTSTAGRKDLRKIPLVTIDPEDARDHDDAVWAGPDSDPANHGGQIVIVAIADVAEYVRSGSVLDREALKRGNSVYFPDRVVPMLPEALSADLCSLREEEDRPCLAVRMVFDSHGVKRRHEFMRGIMRSAARLTYSQAQARVRRQTGREMPQAAGKGDAAALARATRFW